MKFKNIVRILSGLRSCETIIFNGCFLLLIFFMTFSYSFFFTPSSLIFCKSFFKFFILMTCSVSHHICNR